METLLQILCGESRRRLRRLPLLGGLLGLMLLIYVELPLAQAVVTQRVEALTQALEESVAEAVSSSEPAGRPKAPHRRDAPR